MKRTMRIFGLSVLAALSLMAVTAAGAQALTGFLVETPAGNKLNINNGDILHASGGAGQLLTGIGVEVECEEAEGTGTIESSSTASANITFAGCSVTTGSETCAIGESEVPASTKAKLDGSAYVKFAPFKTALHIAKSESPPFANVTFEGVEGEECLLIGAGESSETVEVTGEEAGDPNDNPGTGTGESLTFSTGISEASGVAGLFISGGENEATIDGQISFITVLRPAGTTLGRLITH